MAPAAAPTAATAPAGMDIAAFLEQHGLLDKPGLREALEGIADNTSELALMTDDDMTEVLAPLRLKTLVERKVRSCLLGLKN